MIGKRRIPEARKWCRAPQGWIRRVLARRPRCQRRPTTEPWTPPDNPAQRRRSFNISEQCEQ